MTILLLKIGTTIHTAKNYFMKYTKDNISSHADLVNNCILSCHTPEQLKIAEEMITIFISNRFKSVLNQIELNMYEDHLIAAIEAQKEMIEERYTMLLGYPTIASYLN